MSEPSAVEKLLADHAMACHHGTTIGGFHRCRCACGHEFDCHVFGGWLGCEAKHRAHLAEVLRGDGLVERVAEAINDAFVEWDVPDDDLARAALRAIFGSQRGAQD